MTNPGACWRSDGMRRMAPRLDGVRKPATGRRQLNNFEQIDAMKTYYVVMAIVCAASAVLSAFQRKTGEGFVHGYNVMFTYFAGTTVIWLLTSFLLVRFALRWYRLKTFSATVRGDRTLVLWILCGLTMPLVNFVILRIRALIEYGHL